MRTEVRSDIPSPLDFIDAVTARMVDSAMAEKPAPEVISGLAAVFTGETIGDDDMLNLLAFAQGCHQGAAVYRARNMEVADLYFAMGQDLLSKATNTHAALVALGMQHLGVVRH